MNGAGDCRASVSRQLTPGIRIAYLGFRLLRTE